VVAEREEERDDDGGAGGGFGAILVVVLKEAENPNFVNQDSSDDGKKTKKQMRTDVSLASRLTQDSNISNSDSDAHERDYIHMGQQNTQIASPQP